MFQKDYLKKVIKSSSLAVALVLLGVFACSVEDQVKVKNKPDSGLVFTEDGSEQNESGVGDENESNTNGNRSDATARDTGIKESGVDAKVNRADSGTDAGVKKDSGPGVKDSGPETGQGSADAAGSPSSFKYALSNACYIAGKPIADNKVTVSGAAITSFKVAPPLPNGITVNGTTGTISGTAPTTESAMTEYTVTGSNAAGSTTAKVKIAICAPPSAYWAFEEGTGTTANDTAGNNYHGTLSGTPIPTWVPGKIGAHALQFDGTNNYIEVAHATVFNAPVFSLAAWLYSENTLTAECAYFRRVGGWHVRTDQNGWDIRLEGSEETISTSSGYGFPSGEWHHYVIVVNRTSKTVTFYVDGEQNGTPRDFSNDFEDSTGNVFIGQFDVGYRWHGRIDDVRFYDKALSQTAIETLYQMGQE
jgi:hypothetical protein